MKRSVNNCVCRDVDIRSKARINILFALLGIYIQSADRTNVVIVVVVVSIPIPFILIEFTDHECRAICSRSTHHYIVTDTMIALQTI